MMRLLLLPVLLLLGACTTSPPDNIDNICAIFRDKDDWYEQAVDARKEWNSPISVMMAIMHQESRFRADAEPPFRWFLGFIPLGRPSNAYGYSQALESTWDTYKRSTGRSGADRDDFGDAIDFIGWYNHQSHRRCGIAPGDAYGLYLAYHEGQGGYNRGSYRNKQWLQAVAGKVQRRATNYRSQLLACEEQLKDKGWFDWF